jgi:hypothetical protein
MTTSTAPIASGTHTITAQDRRAMRSADTLVLQLYKGEASIRCIMRADRSATGFEQEHRISCDYTMRDLRRPASGVKVNYVASHYAGSVNYHSDSNRPLHTIMRRMAVGSRVTLDWVRSNQSPVLDDAHMVRDELRLTIVGAKGGTESFLVAISVGLDNSARMIRIDH